MTERPQLWVFAGPNGAGKSTLADRFVRERIPIVNPDNIAHDLPRTAHGGLAELAAGKLALKERGERLRTGQTFAFETTLSGGTELKVMRDAKAEGYKVNLVYVGVSDPAISMARVSERVRRGGHDVDDRAVAQRYAASLAQLPEAMALADRTSCSTMADAAIASSSCATASACASPARCRNGRKPRSRPSYAATYCKRSAPIGK